MCKLPIFKVVSLSLVDLTFVRIQFRLIVRKPSDQIFINLVGIVLHLRYYLPPQKWYYHLHS